MLSNIFSWEIVGVTIVLFIFLLLHDLLVLIGINLLNLFKYLSLKEASLVDKLWFRLRHGTENSQ